FTNGSGGVTVAVTSPPNQGDFNGRNGFVQVIISAPQSTFFLGVLGITSTTVSAYAVAGPGPTNVNMVILRPSGADALHALAGGTLSVAGDIIIDSNNNAAAHAEGNGHIVASGQLNIVGNYELTGASSSITGNPITPSSAYVSDPFANLPIPTTSGGTHG